MGANVHLTQGWQYSAFVGSDGGWELPATNLQRVVCRPKRARLWDAFIVRVSDGATLHHSQHSNRALAMRAAMETV